MTLFGCYVTMEVIGYDYAGDKSSSWFSLLDEPFSGLMPLHIERLKEIMLEEKMNKGAKLLRVAHIHPIIPLA